MGNGCKVFLNLNMHAGQSLGSRLLGAFGTWDGTGRNGTRRDETFRPAFGTPKNH